MKGIVFTAGAEIWIAGRAARIVSAANPKDAEVEYLPSGARDRVDLFALYSAGALTRTSPGEATTAHAGRALETLTEAQRAVAEKRQAVLQPLLDSKTPQAAKEAVARAGVGRSTLFRWRKNFLDHGLRGLIPDYQARGGVGKPKIGEKREGLLQDVLARVYLQPTRPAKKHTYEQVLMEFGRERLAPPSKGTVFARIHALDASTVTKAREGGAKSRDRHMVSRGSSPASPSPLHTILIDHTPLDLHLVDSRDRTRVIGRPFLTLAVDACTRMVFGYFLTLDPPAYLSVAMCLLQGVMPKDDLLAKHGLKGPWPIFGLPSVIFTDNGMDFVSKHLKQVALQYQIQLDQRPVKVPHYGGIIERVIGTVNRYVHPLDGTAKSSVKARGDYDAEKHAYLTLEEAETHILRRITEHYHRQEHRSLGKSPLAAWDEAVKAGTVAPHMPPDPDRFRIDVLPFERRTIQKDGVSLFDLTYTDGRLRSWRNIDLRRGKAQTYVVKYDPRDLSKVYFVPPDGSEIETVPISPRSPGSFSLLELRRSKALAKAEKRTWVGSDLCGMLERERRALDVAAEKTRAAKRAKRTSARVANQRAAVAPATGDQGSGVAAKGGKGRTVAAPVAFNADDWGTPVLNWSDS